MSFKVEHADLESFATQLGRAAEDAEQAKRYCTDNTKINEGGGGLLSFFQGSHDTVVAEVEQTLGRMQTITRSGQRELSSSAKYYRDTDDENAAKVDSTYPASKR